MCWSRKATKQKQKKSCCEKAYEENKSDKCVTNDGCFDDNVDCGKNYEKDKYNKYVSGSGSFPENNIDSGRNCTVSKYDKCTANRGCNEANVDFRRTYIQKCHKAMLDSMIRDQSLISSPKPKEEKKRNSAKSEATKSGKKKKNVSTKKSKSGKSSKKGTKAAKSTKKTNSYGSPSNSLYHENDMILPCQAKLTTFVHVQTKGCGADDEFKDNISQDMGYYKVLSDNCSFIAKKLEGNEITCYSKGQHPDAQVQATPSICERGVTPPCKNNAGVQTIIIRTCDMNDKSEAANVYCPDVAKKEDKKKNPAPEQCWPGFLFDGIFYHSGLLKGLCCSDQKTGTESAKMKDKSQSTKSGKKGKKSAQSAKGKKSAKGKSSARKSSTRTTKSKFHKICIKDE